MFDSNKFEDVDKLRSEKAALQAWKIAELIGTGEGSREIPTGTETGDSSFGFAGSAWVNKLQQHELQAQEIAESGRKIREMRKQ